MSTIKLMTFTEGLFGPNVELPTALLVGFEH